LSSEFVVKDWDGPSYRLDPDGDSDLFEEATDFLDRASACWGTTESLLDELDVKVTNIDNYTGNDSFEPVARALVEAGETIEEIETKIADAGLTDVLGPRLDRTRADLRDGHIEARRTRASKLIDEGGEDLDGGEYEVASQKFQRANEHLEAAESVAGQHEMAETLEAIESQRERLKDRLSEMVARPVQRAEEATNRGLRAAGPDRVDAYEAAIEQYHEALELCRKHDLNPEHDPETLKFSIELLAAGVVDARREWIDEIEGDADTLSLAGQIEDGRERYQEALEETRRTLKIAEQFEAPDPEPFEQAVVDLERKLDNIGEF
jgi:tetratricopeptide (TPR) repeat protein